MNKKDMEKWSNMQSKFDFNEKFVRQNMKKNSNVWKYVVRGCLTAFICLFVLANVSPKYVKAMENVPILGTLNEWFTDVFYSIAKDNNYVQTVNRSINKDGIEFSVIDLSIDEDNMYVNFEVDFGGKNHYNDYLVNIKNQKGRVYGGYERIGSTSRDSGLVHCHFYGEEIEEEYIVELVYNNNHYALEVPVNTNKIAKKEVYELKEKISVEQQSVTIEKVEILPLATKIYVKQDDRNTLDIINMDFAVYIDNQKITLKDAYGYSIDGYDVYVQASSYFLGKEVEVEVLSAQLKEKARRNTFNILTGVFNNRGSLVDFVAVYSKENGDIFEQYSVFKEFQKNNDEYEYLLQFKPQKNVNISLGTISVYQKGVELAFDADKEYIEVRIDEDLLNGKHLIELDFDFGKTVTINKKLKLQ